MKLLLTLHDSDVFPGTQNNDPRNFSLRYAARAVLLNEWGQVALMKVGTLNYHKLPGGGVEENEDMMLALRREVREETGSNITVGQGIGEIIEYKNEQESKQVSRCWLVYQIGEAHTPTFTDKELQNGFALIWTKDIDDAIAIMEQDQPADYTGSFIRLRDLMFLKAAKALIR